MAQKKKNASTKSKKSRFSRLSFFKTRKGMVALLFILAFAGIGGYQVIKSQAKGYTYLGNDGTLTVYACKTYVAAYGGVYNVNFLYNKNKSYPARQYWAYVIRGNNNPIQVRSGSAYWGGTTGSLTVNASAYYKDKVAAQLRNNNGNNTWSSAWMNPANLATC